MLSLNRISSGRLAQLGEHRVRNAGVVGSSPTPSTNLSCRSRIDSEHPSYGSCAAPPAPVANLVYHSGDHCQNSDGGRKNNRRVTH